MKVYWNGYQPLGNATDATLTFEAEEELGSIVPSSIKIVSFAVPEGEDPQHAIPYTGKGVEPAPDAS